MIERGRLAVIRSMATAIDRALVVTAASNEPAAEPSAFLAIVDTTDKDQFVVDCAIDVARNALLEGNDLYAIKLATACALAPNQIKVLVGDEQGTSLYVFQNSGDMRDGRGSLMFSDIGEVGVIQRQLWLTTMVPADGTGTNEEKMAVQLAQLGNELPSNFECPSEEGIADPLRPRAVWRAFRVGELVPRGCRRCPAPCPATRDVE
jgi:hypothetical protein